MILVLAAAPGALAQTVPAAVFQSPPVVSRVASSHDGKRVMTVDASRVAFSHSGKWAATIDPFRGNTTLWDAKTGTKVVAFSHANAVIEAPNKSTPNESLVVYSFQSKDEDSAHAHAILRLSSLTCSKLLTGLCAKITRKEARNGSA
jgi:hypothetical protein